MIDSSLTGGGGHLGNIWFAAAYPEEILNKQYNISELEMLNAVVTLKAVAHVIRGHVINLRCDNAATVAVLETGQGRCPFLLACAQPITQWRYTCHTSRATIMTSQTICPAYTRLIRGTSNCRPGHIGKTRKYWS